MATSQPKQTSKPNQNAPVKTPTLDAYGKDYTKLAQEGKLDPVNAKELGVQMSKIDFEEQRQLRDRALK